MVSLSLFDSLVVGCRTQAEHEVSAVTPGCGESAFLETAVT